jgi:hypothetical protein
MRELKPSRKKQSTKVCISKSFGFFTDTLCQKIALGEVAAPTEVLEAVPSDDEPEANEMVRFRVS